MVFLAMPFVLSQHFFFLSLLFSFQYSFGVFVACSSQLLVAASFDSHSLLCCGNRAACTLFFPYIFSFSSK